MKPIWKTTLQTNNKEQAEILNAFRIQELKSNIHSTIAWKNVCRAFEYPYDKAYVDNEQTKKFRQVLNEMHLLAVFGTHSFKFDQEEVEVKSVRDELLNRIGELKKSTGGFSKHNFRWKGTKFNGVLISDTDFTTLSISELVQVFELIIRNFYKQG